MAHTYSPTISSELLNCLRLLREGEIWAWAS